MGGGACKEGNQLRNDNLDSAAESPSDYSAADSDIGYLLAGDGEPGGTTTDDSALRYGCFLRVC